MAFPTAPSRQNHGADRRSPARPRTRVIPPPGKAAHGLRREPRCPLRCLPRRDRRSVPSWPREKLPSGQPRRRPRPATAATVRPGDFAPAKQQECTVAAPSRLVQRSAAANRKSGPLLHRPTCRPPRTRRHQPRPHNRRHGQRLQFVLVVCCSACVLDDFDGYRLGPYSGRHFLRPRAQRVRPAAGARQFHVQDRGRLRAHNFQINPS